MEWNSAGVFSHKSPPRQIDQLSILLTEDFEIGQLNGTFRGKHKPTDVLSFSQTEGAGQLGASLGDIVISVDTARKQSRQFKVTFKHELLRLLIHGVLHLLGYDHERVSDKKRRQMKNAEKSLLNSHVL